MRLNKKNIGNATFVLVASVSSSYLYAENFALEEILVTAQKKEQLLQDVPIAVSAVSASALANAAINDTQTSALTISGLNYSQTAGAGVPVIRGIGSSNVVLGDESSVATYVDGAYRPFRAGNVFSFNNIERVEVLKGPQGALFGRNATGGVIQIITKDPSHDPIGDIEVGVDNYSTATVKAYVSNGLSENIAADLAIYYGDQHKGWGENLTSGNDDYYTREFSARSKWLWSVSDATEILVSLETVDSFFSNGYRLTGDSIALDGSSKPADFYDIRSTYSPELDTEQNIFTASVEHDFGWGILRSVTAYQNFNGVQWLDNDVTESEILNARLDQTGTALTEELQVTGFYKELGWIAGVFLMDNSAGHDSVLLSGAALGGGYLDTKAIQDTTTYSPFIQVSYPITEKLSVTAGLRYTVDKQELDYRINNNGSVVAEEKLDEKFTKTSPGIVFDYRVDDDVMLYASYNSGFKSGLFNTVEPQRPVVDPEELNAYEIGLKSELLDRRVRFNVAGYYYDYSDFQVLHVVQAATVLLNAGNVETYGLDADLDWAVTEDLTLRLGLALLNGEYTKFEDAPVSTSNSPQPGSTIVAGNVKGNDITRAPEQQYIVGITYNLSESLTYSLNFSRTSDFYWEPDNRLKQDPLNKLNMTLSWNSSDSKYGVQLWGRNLLDEEYDAFAIALPFGDIAQAAAPMTFGVNVNYHFE